MDIKIYTVKRYISRDIFWSWNGSASSFIRAWPVYCGPFDSDFARLIPTGQAAARAFVGFLADLAWYNSLNNAGCLSNSRNRLMTAATGFASPRS